jgi:hypothetical protein
MGLIRFLIIAISVIYIIRTLARIFLPYLFKKAVHKMAQQQQANQQQNQGKPEGTISVDFVPPSAPKKPKLDQAGDFVDYEELK